MTLGGASALAFAASFGGGGGGWWCLGGGAEEASAGADWKEFRYEPTD